jgi:hypothetical protein
VNDGPQPGHNTGRFCREGPLADIEPRAFHAGRREWPAERPPERQTADRPAADRPASERIACVTFDRRELDRILHLYGRMVALGEWRDYAIDFMKDRAVFSVFRRASEVPLYRIEKDPRLARKQGMYSVVSATGLILRRGHELERVLLVIDRKLAVV